jgi:hypothetical protein
MSHANSSAARLLLQKVKKEGSKGKILEGRASLHQLAILPKNISQSSIALALAHRQSWLGRERRGVATSGIGFRRHLKELEMAFKHGMIGDSLVSA